MELILGATRRAVIEKIEEERAVKDLRPKHQCRAACDNEAYRAASSQGSEADIEPVGHRSPKGDQAEQQHTCPERKTALERYRLPQFLEQRVAQKQPALNRDHLGKGPKQHRFKADVDRGGGHDHGVLGYAYPSHGNVAGKQDKRSQQAEQKNRGAGIEKHGTRTEQQEKPKAAPPVAPTAQVRWPPAPVDR